MKPGHYVSLATVCKRSDDRRDLLEMLKRGVISSFAERYRVLNEKAQPTDRPDQFNWPVPPDFWIQAAATSSANYINWSLSWARYRSKDDLIHCAEEIFLTLSEVDREFPIDERITPDRPHRPKGRSWERADMALVREMKRLLDDGEAMSPTDAARRVIGKDGSLAKGAGDVSSKIRRLIERYKRQIAD